MKFDINTKIFKNGDIVQSTELIDNMDLIKTLSREVIVTKEKQIREALISLGWVPPEVSIFCGWMDEDIVQKAKELEIKLTPKQVLLVRDYIEKHFDANIGVCWDTIEEAIKEVT